VNQQRDADETQKQVTAKSLRIAEEQKECKKLEELARADLATVEPALNEAMKVLVELSPGNIIPFWTMSKFPITLFLSLSLSLFLSLFQLQLVYFYKFNR